jgi:hypothetical protein
LGRDIIVIISQKRHPISKTLTFIVRVFVHKGKSKGPFFVIARLTIIMTTMSMTPPPKSQNTNIRTTGYKSPNIYSDKMY